MRLLHPSAGIALLLLNIYTNCSHLLSASRKFLRLNSQSVFSSSRRRLIISDSINLCYNYLIRSNSKNKSIKNVMLNNFPLFTSGKIVRGFGRGSRELGIPTANFPLEVVKALPAEISLGIYYGWANVDNREVYKMVMSIGTNPYYDNKEKSMETHILHKYDGDLYGHLLKVCIVGYLRPERNFETIEELISAIQKDIEDAKKFLDKDEEKRQLQYSKFFQADH